MDRLVGADREAVVTQTTMITLQLQGKKNERKKKYMLNLEVDKLQQQFPLLSDRTRNLRLHKCVTDKFCSDVNQSWRTIDITKFNGLKQPSPLKVLNEDKTLLFTPKT